MPLLARILTAPLVVDVRRGAVADLGALLADRRIATEGRVAVAVGPGQGDSVLADLDPDLGPAKVFRVEDGTVDCAVSLGKQLRADAYEAVAGIGGGKTIDVTKFAAHMAGIPMVAVATNLAHDGIASPISSLEHESGKGSYGVVPPVAVIVDLDRVRSGPPRLVRAGIGDVVNNLSAIADWELAAADRGEPVDGLAVTLARTAAQAVLHQPGTVRRRRVPHRAGRIPGAVRDRDDGGRVQPARAAAATTRSCTPSTSCSPARAITASWPESARCSALTCAETTTWAALMSACLARHGLPRTPGRPRAQSRRVHPGGAARARDQARPVHHPGAARAGRVRDRAAGGGLRRGRRERSDDVRTDAG